MTTMKVQPIHPSQGDYVVIEKQDFNPKVHKPCEEVDDGLKPAEPRRRGRPPKSKEN